MMGDSTAEYFSDGLTEEMITVRSQMHGLRVIAGLAVLSSRSGGSSKN